MLMLRAPASACRASRAALLYRPVRHRQGYSCNRSRVAIVRATSESTEDPSAKIVEKVTEVSKVVQEKWEETEDKPAAIIVATAIFVGLYAVSSVVDAVDKIPIFSDVFELIGLVVTGWLGFRLLTAEADRKELLATVAEFVGKVTGQKS